MLGSGQGKSPKGFIWGPPPAAIPVWDWFGWVCHWCSGASCTPLCPLPQFPQRGWGRWRGKAKIRAERCPWAAPCPILTRAQGTPAPFLHPGVCSPLSPWVGATQPRGPVPLPRSRRWQLGVVSPWGRHLQPHGTMETPMSQGGTLGCWGGALLNPAMPGSFWAMELGVAASGTALAVPWCRVFRGRAAPAVFARGVYCKSLSGCLRAITRRQVSALGTLPEGSWQLRERGAGDAQHRVAPHPRCSRSLWGILLGNPSPYPCGAGTARRQGVNVGVSWH